MHTTATATTATITTRAFLLAGKATATLVSKKSGAHLTFKVSKGKDESAPHFVSVMTGADNESSFSYLGTIFQGATYRHGARSKITADAASAKAFAWLWDNADKDIAGVAEFLPASACCRCGRKLTHPASIHQAVGPECAKKM